LSTRQCAAGGSTHLFGFFSGVTTLLALSVYQIIVNEKLPATSDDVPVIGNILAQCLIFKPWFHVQIELF